MNKDRLNKIEAALKDIVSYTIFNKMEERQSEF
jgi:hypothetical protein